MNDMNDSKKDKPFRILSLDGGGMRGVITATLLRDIEKEISVQAGRPVPLHEYFDMIAGTSTGSLIAAGAAVGIGTDQMVDIYFKQGLDIFPYQSLFAARRWELVRKYGPSAPKFSNAGLIKVIRALFNKSPANTEPRDRDDILLGEVGSVKRENGAWVSADARAAKPILLILAYDCTYRNTTFFTNQPPDPAKRWYLQQPLWKVCVSSAAAPTFFPALELEHTEIDKDGKAEPWSFPHVDGGVTAGNPALCAISRAIELGHKLEDIQLLSIGTGQNKKPLEFKEVEGWGLVQWGLHIPDVFMDGQAELQDHICCNLLGGLPSNRYLRLQFDLNQTFAEPVDILAPAPLLAPEQRVNKWLGQPIKEEIDDARTATLELFQKAAELYLEKGLLYESRFEHYGSVKSNIRNFIKGEAMPRLRVAK